MWVGVGGCEGGLSVIFFFWGGGKCMRVIIAYLFGGRFAGVGMVWHSGWSRSRLGLDYV